MHLFDRATNFYGGNAIVGGGLPLSIGLALADHMRGENTITACFFGEGAVAEGEFHESMNLAALWGLPVLFVCENNLYSVYTGLSERQPSRPITNVAMAHDMHAARADGNDVEAVLKATHEAVDRARSGNGPSFLQFDTYRWREHCGPAFDNNLGYRTMEEYEEWRAKDPIDLTRRKLHALKLVSEADEKQMAAELQAQIDEAFAFAKAAPLPDPSQASQFVYAER